jgi:mannose-1-phosphate guanylyltransferase
MKEWLDNSKYAGRISAVYEEKPLGTGGTLLYNQDFADNDQVMLVHADNLCITDFRSFMHAHECRPPNTEITMMTFRSTTPHTCGIVELDKQGVVQAFYEKVKNPPSNLANAAVYILEPQIMDFLKGLGKPFIDFTMEVIPHYIGKIYTYYNGVYHRDVGTFESYISAQIESPISIAAPEYDCDSWFKLCNRKSLYNDFLLSLANAFCAEIIETPDTGIVLHSMEAGQMKNYIVAFKDNKIDARQAIDHLEKKGVPLKKIIFFIQETTSGFSSKTMFEKYGIKSLVVCAHA